jgi:hypothetical protein
LLRREYGVGVRQVQGVTLNELYNVYRYTVASCMEDTIATASIYVGCGTGRRPRFVGSIHLKHVICRAHEAWIGEEGQSDIVMVASIK